MRELIADLFISLDGYAFGEPLEWNNSRLAKGDLVGTDVLDGRLVTLEYRPAAAE